jgi:hypothetical protein
MLIKKKKSMSITIDNQSAVYIMFPEDHSVGLSTAIAVFGSKALAAAFNSQASSQRRGKNVVTHIYKSLNVLQNISVLDTQVRDGDILSPKTRLLLRIVGLDLFKRLHGPEDKMLADNTYTTKDYLPSQLAILRSPERVDFSKFIVTELSTTSPKPPRSRGRRGRKRRRRQRRRYESESSDDDSSSSESDAPSSNHKRAKVVNDPTSPPPETALIKYTTRNEALQYLNQWSDPEALVAMPHLCNSGLMMLMGGTTQTQFQRWMDKLGDAWLQVKMVQLIAQANLPLEQAKVEQEKAKKAQEEERSKQEEERSKQEEAKKAQEEAKKAQEEERSKQEETKRKANLITDRSTKRQADQELWKLKTAEKKRQEKEFRELQEAELERKDVARTKELERKDVARTKELARKRQAKLDKQEDEHIAMELNKEEKLAAIAVEKATFELSRLKERPGKPMKVAAHGLPEVPNVANVVAAVYEGKTGIITCQGAGCGHSVMMFAPKVITKVGGAGAPMITCTPCAETATAAGSLTHRSDLSLTRKRINVWMTRHGFKTKSLCQLCEQGPEIPLHGGWDCLHDVPVQKVVKESYKDKWIGESPCNMKQGTSRIDEFRQIKHGLGPVSRAEALVVDAGSRESRKALAFALDHHNSEKRVRAKLLTLLPRGHRSMQSFLVRRTTTTTEELLV